MYWIVFITEKLQLSQLKCMEKKWFLGTPKQILRWKLLPNRWHIGEVTPLLC